MSPSTSLLREGAIEFIGRHPEASNAVFVVSVRDAGGTATRAIYKPIAGERPLWDFPRGELARREVAAYALAVAMGFSFIPETVWRDDAPAGPGSLQRWIEDAEIQDVDVVPDASPGWRHVLDAQLSDGTAVQLVHRDLDELRALALFDAVVNNGDRKGGHILRDPAGTLCAVDHGVTFHAEPRLRTVLWGFEGEVIPSGLLERLSLDVRAVPELIQTLDDEELQALERRIAQLRTDKVFPGPSEEWPSIPWPVY